tara:strand:+ start:533 stop:1021 length:489 start_codon:yes stop_codon:yes gene_type:complete
MQKFVVHGRPQAALTRHGLGLCARHYREYWYLPRKANERWIMTMNSLEHKFELGGDLGVDSVALSFQMARISLLRYGHSLAELELFCVTALLLIDVLGEEGNPEAAFTVLLEALCVFSDVSDLTNANPDTIEHLESQLVREATAISRKHGKKPVLRLVHSTS